MTLDLIERAINDMREIALIDRIGGAPQCVRRAEGFEALIAYLGTAPARLPDSLSVPQDEPENSPPPLPRLGDGG